MSKPARLSSVKSTHIQTFVYTPPATAYDAVRIVVKPNLDTVRPEVLTAVLRGLRRANPGGRIIVLANALPERDVETVFGSEGSLDLLDSNMQAILIDRLATAVYSDPRNPARSVEAPRLLGEAECRISVAGAGPGIIAALDHLRRLIQGPYDSLMTADLYCAIGRLFDGAVLEVDEQVLWGDDLLAVELAAARIYGHISDELAALRDLHSQLQRE